MSTYKDIDISYIWDKDTYLQASKLAYDYELKKSNRKYLGWFFIAMTQFGVVAAMKQGSIGLLLISTVLVVYWYYFRWSIRKKFILKTFDKLSNANMNYNLKLFDKKLVINEKEIEWDNITEVLALSDGVFIYLNQNSIFIPNSAFSEFEDRSDFLSILKNSVTNYTREG